MIDKAGVFVVESGFVPEDLADSGSNFHAGGQVCRAD
jgi:hypothetical protein